MPLLVCGLGEKSAEVISLFAKRSERMEGRQATMSLEFYSRSDCVNLRAILLVNCVSIALGSWVLKWIECPQMTIIVAPR